MTKSIFDILGPVMIGPSSSHTAGAVRIGRIAREICGGDIISAVCTLHGSFATTYKGHGTDLALVAGLFGMSERDENIKNSLALAKDKEVDISFAFEDLGDVHENTANFKIKTSKEVVSVTGSSVGGGNVIIVEINGFDVNFTGKSDTIIITHFDKKGTIAKVSNILTQADINIATMSVSRKSKGRFASMMIECDGVVPPSLSPMLCEIEDVIEAQIVSKVR